MDPLDKAFETVLDLVPYFRWYASVIFDEEELAQMSVHTLFVMAYCLKSELGREAFAMLPQAIVTALGLAPGEEDFAENVEGIEDLYQTFLDSELHTLDSGQLPALSSLVEADPYLDQAQENLILNTALCYTLFKFAKENRIPYRYDSLDLKILYEMDPSEPMMVTFWQPDGSQAEFEVLDVFNHRGKIYHFLVEENDPGIAIVYSVIDENGQNNYLPALEEEVEDGLMELFESRNPHLFEP